MTDCLSTVEAFFLARFHLYRWTIWHHNAIRTDLALTRAVHLLLTLPRGSLPDAGQNAREWIATPLSSESTEEYNDFDDAGLLYHLRQVRRALKGPQEGPLKELALLLDVFLSRRIDRLHALWKTTDEYGRFAQSVVGGDKRAESVLILNGKLTNMYNTNYREVSHKFEERLEGALSSADGRVYARYLWRFKPAPDRVTLLAHDGMRIPLTDLSPAVMALNAAWSGLPHLWLYVADGREEGHTDRRVELVAIAKRMKGLLSGRK